MALIGEKHLGNFTTAGRPAAINGSMYFDTTDSQLKVACNSVWYKASCNYAIVDPDVCYVIIAGGGGGGGGNGGGGGGAGGVVHGNSTLGCNVWYCVHVGAGGGGSQSFNGQAYSGANSKFITTEACGGGYGNWWPNNVSGTGGGDGGSGGGSGTYGPDRGYAINSGAQGNNGGCRYIYGGASGAGGGGFTGVGLDATWNPGPNPAHPVLGGCGGSGICFYNNLTYGVAGGGGGLSDIFPSSGNYPLAPATDGGGRGGNASPSYLGNPATGDPAGRQNGRNATANTGGGGGGGPADSPGTGNQNGGSGVIFLIYPAPQYTVCRSTPTISISSQLDAASGCCLTCVLGGSGCVCFHKTF